MEMRRLGFCEWQKKSAMLTVVKAPLDAVAQL